MFGNGFLYYITATYSGDSRKLTKDKGMLPARFVHWQNWLGVWSSTCSK